MYIEIVLHFGSTLVVHPLNTSLFSPLSDPFNKQVNQEGISMADFVLMQTSFYMMMKTLFLEKMDSHYNYFSMPVFINET